MSAPMRAIVHALPKTSLSQIRQRAEGRKPANRCAMEIDGEQVWVDINNYTLLPGQRAVTIDTGGVIKIQTVTPHVSDFRPMGDRMAMGESYRTPYGSTARNSVIIIGAVIEQFSGLTIEGTPA